MSDWDSARRECMRLEGQLEDKLGEYSRLAQRLGSDFLSEPTGGARGFDPEDPLLSGGDGADAVAARDEQRLAGEVEALLAAMCEANERLAAAARESGSAEHAARLARAREVRFDYSSEFKRASAALQRRREAAELFRGSNDARRGGGGALGAKGHLMNEQKSIQGSLKAGAGVIDQAQEVRSSLLRQRQALTGAFGRMGGVAEGLPGVQRIIDAIHKKKVRENTIIGCVVGGLICFTIWWLV